MEKTPKITVNKLGEYIVSNPSRQRKILEQIKYPVDYKFGAVAHYDARKAIVNFLCGDFKENALNLCIKKLEKSVPSSDYQKNMNLVSIEALNNVLDFCGIDNKLSFETYRGKNPKITIKGVDISVNPDVIVLSQNRNGISVGALKVHISKTYSLTDEASRYVAAMLYYFMENTKCNGMDHPLKAANCISYDVFSGLVVVCPKSTKRMIGNIEACCSNIASIWDGI